MYSLATKPPTPEQLTGVQLRLTPSTGVPVISTVWPAAKTVIWEASTLASTRQTTSSIATAVSIGAPAGPAVTASVDSAGAASAASSVSG